MLLEAIKEQQIKVPKTRAAPAETKPAQATATLETFEAWLRCREASSGQAQRY
ncbi:MAG: hypothetical protein ACRYFZ_04850 [Janthinobacterium lividum]